MYRAGIAIFAVFLFFSDGDLFAQQPTPLTLKLSISDDLRRRYGLDPQECASFEKSVSEKIVGTIADRYWYRFCWQLRAAVKDDPAPDGEIRIELDRNKRRDNWVMVVTVSRENSPRVQHSFAPVEVLESGELLRTHGPTKEKLAGDLGEWLRQNYFSDDKVPQLHARLRLIPVGKGVPSTAMTPKPHGAVLIPWEKYNQFRWSRFRFECNGQNGLEHWLSTASGGPMKLGDSEVIDVVHDQVPPGQVEPSGAVFLVEFVEESLPTTDSNRSELMMVQ
jgi:hypothetical protein